MLDTILRVYSNAPCEVKYRLMEDIVEQGILYDIYGPLLTEHQRFLYERKVNDNMSLTEIAAEAGISRQGVHDQLRKVDKALLDYEEKIGLASQGKKTADGLTKIIALCEAGEPDFAKIKEIALGLLEEY